MEQAERTAAVGVLRARVDLATVALWLIPAVLVVYLALQNGGYGVVERSEVGIAVWWIVLVGAAVGALPSRAALTPAALFAFGALALFTLWTTISLSWTESEERTAIEIARAASYAGIFALALSVQRGERWRAVLGGLTTGVAAVLALALLSRLQPNLFPDQVAGDFFPGVQLERRLAYPLNYSTGLAALAAMALPLLLYVAATARRLGLQALAAAMISVSLLVVWLTASSLLIPLTLVALISYLALAPDRLASLATLVLAGVGAGVMVLAVEQRDALDTGIVTPAALEQGDEMTAMVIVVVAGVALMQAGLGLLLRHFERPAWLSPSPRTTRRVAGAVIALALIAALVTPLRGEIGDAWDKFRGQSEFDDQSSTRLEQVLDPSSRGRYQFWESAFDAGKAEPLTGLGAGTFEFWWSRERDAGGFARDAHSLYVESFAELGIPGLLLIVSFTLGVVWLGVVRTLRAPPTMRPALAAAASAAIVFIVAAAVDWMWELALLPALFVVLAAILIAGGRRETTPHPGPRIGWRVGAAVLAIAAIAVIAVPLSSTTALSDSQAAAADNRLDAALDRARDAAAIEPYAATPELQQALILEQAGDLDGAVIAAREAVAGEPTNWRTWLILSRLEARTGDAQAAVEAYREARSLNPLSPIFDPPQ